MNYLQWKMRIRGSFGVASMRTPSVGAVSGAVTTESVRGNSRGQRLPTAGKRPWSRLERVSSSRLMRASSTDRAHRPAATKRLTMPATTERAIQPNGVYRREGQPPGPDEVCMDGPIVLGCCLRACLAPFTRSGTPSSGGRSSRPPMGSSWDPSRRRRLASAVGSRSPTDSPTSPTPIPMRLSPVGRSTIMRAGRRRELSFSSHCRRVASRPGRFATCRIPDPHRNSPSGPSRTTRPRNPERDQP